MSASFCVPWFGSISPLWDYLQPGPAVSLLDRGRMKVLGAHFPVSISNLLYAGHAAWDCLNKTCIPTYMCRKGHPTNYFLGFSRQLTSQVLRFFFSPTGLSHKQKQLKLCNSGLCVNKQTAQPLSSSASPHEERQT